MQIIIKKDRYDVPQYLFVRNDDYKLSKDEVLYCVTDKDNVYAHFLQAQKDYRLLKDIFGGVMNDKEDE